MKVKEYLVNRILELEHDLKHARNEKAGVVYGLQKLQEDVDNLQEKIEQYQMEREHIREIIVCNIKVREVSYGYDSIRMESGDNDFNTLLGLLNIKREDYDNKEVTEDAENTD